MTYNASDSGYLSTRRFVTKVGLSAAAATIAETVTFPLDLVKTRLQIQGERDGISASNSNENHVTVRRGTLSITKGIVDNEGYFGLWRGLTPAIYRHIAYTGARMGIYELMRDSLYTKSHEDKFPIWKSALCGMTAGAFGQFVANPTDLVKVHMQMEGKRVLEGKPVRYRNAWHAFSAIYAQLGLRGLWKGWVPNVQRAALVNMGDLTTYETAKHYILSNSSLKDNWVTHLLASLCAGLVAALLSTPADVVKTRIMNQPHDNNGRGVLYRSSLDCLRKTVRLEGFSALYKGFVVIYVRMAPWSLTFWVSYEEIRKFCGLGNF